MTRQAWIISTALACCVALVPPVRVEVPDGSGGWFEIDSGRTLVRRLGTKADGTSLRRRSIAWSREAGELLALCLTSSVLALASRPRR